MVSISAPSIRNTFAVLRRFMECLLREFTAMNARPPAIRPAALLLIYASVFFDMVISSFLKVYINIFCNFRKNIPEAMPEIDSSDTWNARKYVIFCAFCNVCIVELMISTVVFVNMPKCNF